MRKGARVIDLSFGADSALTATAVAIGEAERKGVVVVAATGDKDTPLDAGADRFPAPAKFNGVVVNSKTAANEWAGNSSTGPLVTVAAPDDGVEPGGINPATNARDSTGVARGSSFAAPWTAGLIADAMSRYPNATSNQILQLVLRTTGGTLHNILNRISDGFGYGTPSLTAMYANDPTQFADVNPLLRDDADPPTSEILGRSSES